MTPGPDKNMDTGTLLKELIKASINAAKMPEVIFGKRMLKKACTLVHPKVQAASSIETSVCSMADPTTRII